MASSLTIAHSTDSVRLQRALFVGALILSLGLPSIWVQIGVEPEEAKQVLLAVTVVALVGAASLWDVRSSWQLFRPVVAIAASGAVATVFAINRFVSSVGSSEHAGGLIVLLLLVAAFYVVTERTPYVPNIRAVVATTVAVVGVLASIYATLQALGIDVIEYAHYGRPMGTFDNPDYLSSYLIVAIPLTFGVMTKHPRLQVLLISIEVLGLLSAGGRAATFALIVTGILFIPKLKWRAVLAALLILGVLGFMRASFHGEDRVFIWKASIAELAHRPLTGYGLDSIPRTLSSYRVPLDQAGYADDAYNAELDILMETGILGLMTYVPVIVVIASRGAAALRDARLRALLLPFCAALFAHCLDAQFSISPIVVQFESWIVAGVLVGTMKESH